MPEKSINNLGYVDNTTLMEESEEELKSFLVRLKEESEKADVKLNSEKTKIMSSSHITSCKEMGKQWKKCHISFSWASKSLQTVTVATKLKDTCFLQEKLTDLDSTLKSRDITLLSKFCIVKVMFLFLFFSCIHEKIQNLDHKEGRVPKNCLF